MLTQTFSKDQYLFQEEIGKTGNEHLQGVIMMKNARSFSGMKKLCGWHIEKMRSKKHAIDYCSKEETRNGKVYTNMVLPKKIKILEEKKFYKWQKSIIGLIKEEPDDRTINWYWDRKGCKGKTAIAKFIVVKHDALVVNGKQNDMFNAILTYHQKKKKFPAIVIIDIPRSMEKYVSWAAIEKIKDGLFYSGKYEGGMVVMNSPHVLCFANFEADKTLLSEDRWKIVKLGAPTLSLGDGFVSTPHTPSAVASDVDPDSRGERCSTQRSL